MTERITYNTISILGIHLSLRKNELKNIWKTTARHGNREYGRVKGEKYGRVGQLNKLINISGALHRNYFTCMYRFDEPDNLGTHKGRNIWGYQSGDELGEVHVAHGPDLPELDFADMIRSHTRELSRKSFILGFAGADFSNYTLLLIRRLAPFTDYVYTDGDVGRWGFKRQRNQRTRENHGPCADEILREIISEIESLHGNDIRHRPRPSGRWMDIEPKIGAYFFRQKIQQLLNPPDVVSNEEKKRRTLWAGFIEDKLEKEILTDRDVKRLYETVSNRARWEGIKSHGIITDGFVQPFNLERFILDRKQYFTSDDDLLIAAEVPVDTPEGKGKADLVVFKPELSEVPSQLENTVILRPIGVFDIKTRTAFNFEIKSKVSTGKRKKVMPNILTTTRGTSNSEWQSILESNPRPTDITQLEHYANGIERAYQKISHSDESLNLARGIIVLDTQQNPSILRQAIIELLLNLGSKGIIKQVDMKPDRILIRNRGKLADKLALVLEKPDKEQVIRFSNSNNIEVSKRVYNPFERVAKRKKKHILYLSISSASKSGPSAAWNAKYWHGLQFIDALRTYENKDIIWFDLAGTLSHRELAATRLRIDQQTEQIQELFSIMRFKDLSSAVDNYLFKGASTPEILSFVDHPVLNSDKTIVIVSGWDLIHNSTPHRLSTELRELERSLVDQLSVFRCTILWFGEAVVDERTSEKYHRRCVLPFRDYSPHRSYVSDIVWNLPLRPYAITQTAPILDDIRVIFHQNRERIEKEVVEIPPLKGWAARFWSRKRKKKSRESKSERGRDALSAEIVMNSDMLQKEFFDDASELIPWIRELWPNEFDANDTPSLGVTPQVVPSFGKSAKARGILSYVAYRAKPRGNGTGKGYLATSILLPKEEITHSRHYRKDELNVTPTKHVYRAPDERLLQVRPFREDSASSREIRRLKRVIIILKNSERTKSIGTVWKEFLQELQSIVQSPDVTLDILNKVSVFLGTNQISSELWDKMSWVRESRLSDGLRYQAKDFVDNLLEARPYIATLYGNYLFLLLLGVFKIYPSLNENDILTLWNTMKAWILVQIGLRELDIETKNRPLLDLRSIWLNLNKRAQTLENIIVPSQQNVRFGKILYFQEDQDYHWLFLEDKYDRSHLISGIWIGFSPLSGLSMRWAESNHCVITENTQLTKLRESQELMAATIDGRDYLWVLDDGEWQFLGELTIIFRRKDAITRIRGLEIKPLETEAIPEPPQHVTKSKTLDKRIKKELKGISQLSENIVLVTCQLGIEKGFYVVEFEAEGKEIDSYVTDRTSELLSILRRPLVEGLPLQNSQKPHILMTWNLYEDIEYDNLLILRPYVERRRPYIDIRVPLPITCEELLGREQTKLELVISHDDAACPIDMMYNREHGNCWRITPDSANDEVLTVFSEPVSDSDVTSLLASKELFLESGRYALSISFSPRPDSREGLVFRESKSIARFLKKKAVDPGKYLTLDDEKLLFQMKKDDIGIRCTILSTLTGEILTSQIIFQPIPRERWDIDAGVRTVEETIEAFVNEYFGDVDNVRDKVEDYDSLIQEVRSILKDIKKK